MIVLIADNIAPLANNFLVDYLAVSHPVGILIIKATLAPYLLLWVIPLIIRYSIIESILTSYDLLFIVKATLAFYPLLFIGEIFRRPVTDRSVSIARTVLHDIFGPTTLRGKGT